MDIPLTVRKLIGLRKFGPITLKRGMITDDTLWDWYRNIVTGRARPPQRQRRSSRTNSATTCCGGTSRTRGPTRSKARRSRPRGNEVAIESIELIVEDITLEVA